jgi:hypothetical protein
MTIAISPKHTADSFENGMSLDEKIEVFVARVEGWQLGIAREVVDKDIPHRGFALLNIVTSYFEMIAKYNGDFAGKERPHAYFDKGVLAVFPMIAQWPKEARKGFLESLYRNVRNGLYHVGMVGPNVILSGELTAPIQYCPETKLVAINPDKLVEALQSHFNAYANDLRDQTNVTLRQNF